LEGEIDDTLTGFGSIGKILKRGWDPECYSIFKLEASGNHPAKASRI
jgi:hypothetical protein